MEYGKLLQICRERAGFSQDEMAFRMNVTQATISKYENNKRSMDITTFMNWFQQTNSPEVAIAFLYGIDGVTILQQLISTIPMFAWLFVA